MVYLRQRSSPVAASYETTLPRKIQQVALGSATMVDSSDVTGTINWPPTNWKLPIILAAGCSSTRFRHSGVLSTAFTA